MSINQLAVIPGQNVPKIILKWEYCHLLLTLLKVFKNTSIETSYFTKMFYLSKEKFYLQRMNKKKL